MSRSPKRRTILIRIEDSSCVRVVAPGHLAEEHVQEFIQEKASWITRKLAYWNTRHPFSSNSVLPDSGRRCFHNGQEFLFLGKKLKFELTESDINAARLNFDGTRWLVEVPRSLPLPERMRQIEERLTIWYRLQAKEILGARVFHYGRALGVRPQEIVVKCQKRIWGSCHPRKQRINLNWQIIMSPGEVFDYVVVHELCHLSVPNHSSAFWQKVKSILPDYQSSREWLKIHQNEMKLPSGV